MNNLETMYTIAQALIIALVGGILAYLAFLSLLASFNRNRRRTISFSYRRIAVVIPAHNEETAIQRTVLSALACDYPRQQFDVVVIADNCTDHTEAIARMAGAAVLVRTNPILRGKGCALAWAFDRLLARKPPYDAFVVVDADSTLSRNFLLVMNDYLEQGANVLQASDLVEPYQAAWNTLVTRIGFALYNVARPLGRMAIGCSAGLRGNGMCFSRGILQDVPWRAYSLNEDLEYGLILLLNGVSVTFAPEASVHAVMPHNPRHAESQRARWEGGRYEIIRKYTTPLFRQAVTARQWKYFDALVDLVTPPFVNMMALMCLLFAVCFGIWLFEIHDTSGFFKWYIVVFGLAAIHVFAGLKAANADRSMYRAAFYIPQYIVWKLNFYLKLARSGLTKEWVRTTREGVTVKPHSTKASR
jgi:1,2-diacylglycerol 3-beta-glucosyltransferase